MLEFPIVVVGDAAVFDVEAVEPAPVALLVPAEMVVEAPYVFGMRVGHRTAEILFDLGAKLRYAPVGDQVFDPGGFAVAAVVEIPIDFDDSGGGVDDFVRAYE